MTSENKFNRRKNYPSLSPIPILLGAGIAFLVISTFVFGADSPNPEWGKYWMIRPLILTPLAGALGGAFYAFLSYQTSRGFNRTVAILLSLVVYLISLWLGVVLGLAGTMWD
ncbi:potassium transporter KefB [Rufibacter sp. H-1]|uniref:Potassium transporter KefB n=2 Tax=Rufibacter sediminis TaxID=2762756 RepID=A0ABR6VYT1_9BACT|nr:potassium transporter KefB [Rufibacter sediminis]